MSANAKKFLVLNASKNEILIHGPIGKSFWSDDGVSGKEFTDALDEFPKGTKVTIGVNSQGGSVGEGLAIYNAIARRAGDITVRIDGYALSIASFFPLAASKVVSPKSSIWMIHNAWSWSQGNAKQLRKDASMLEKHDETIIQGYLAKTGKSRSEIESAMEDETWMTGEEAIAWGLADEESGNEPELEALDFSPAPQNAFKRIPTNAGLILAAVAKGDRHLQGPVTAPAAIPISAPVQGAANNTKTKDQMKREKIIALLNKHGIEFVATATDEDLMALLDKIPAGEQGKADSKELEKLRKQFAAAEAKRIRAEIIRRAENKIPNDKLQGWIDKAIADEEGVLALIDSLPANVPGGDPVSHVIELSAESPLEALRKKHATPVARAKAMKEDWENLFADAEKRDKREMSRGRSVQASNTYSATLVTAFLIDDAITNLQNMWAPLGLFSRDYSADSFKPLAAGTLRQVTAGAATQTDATNFESGNSTVTAVQPTMHQYSQSFQVSNTDLQNGLRMEYLTKINLANFANKIIEVATAPFTVANYATLANYVSAPGAFGWSDMATLWGNLKKSPIKNALLDGEYLARLINTPGFFQTTPTGSGSYSAFGWDQIALNTDWTGAGANVRGVTLNPQALIGVMGLPVAPPDVASGGVFSLSTFMVPGPNISVALYRWFNPAGRVLWTSYDVMAGFAAGDTTAAQLITSA